MNSIVTNDGYILERINPHQLLFSKVDGGILENYGKKYLDAYYDMLSENKNLDDESIFWLINNLIIGINEDQKSILLMEARLADRFDDSKIDLDKNDDLEVNTFYLYCKEGSTINEYSLLPNLLTQIGYDPEECSIEKLCDSKYTKITFSCQIKRAPRSFQKRFKDIFKQ